MTDKALEADKWPEPPEAVWVWGKYHKYVETYCDPTEIKQDEFEVPVTKYIRADLAVSDPLSALPGEAEVDGEIRELVAWLIERSKPDSGLTFGDNSHGIAEATVTGYDAAFVADHFHGTGAVRLADALQALQARALVAERERDYWRKLHDERTAFLGQCATEKEAAEARVKDAMGLLDHLIGWIVHDCGAEPPFTSEQDETYTALSKGGSNG